MRVSYNAKSRIDSCNADSVKLQANDAYKVASSRRFDESHAISACNHFLLLLATMIAGGALHFVAVLPGENGLFWRRWSKCSHDDIYRFLYVPTANARSGSDQHCRS